MLGKTSVNPAARPAVIRLPMWCARDFRPGGCLCHIFSSMYAFKTNQKWTEFESEMNNYKNNAKRLTDMSKEIFQNLIGNKCLRLPTVYIRPEITNESREEIKSLLIERTLGELTDDADFATHILYEKSDDVTATYARPLFKQGQNIMMHWCYLPQSYDTFTPNKFDLSVCRIYFSLACGQAKFSLKFEDILRFKLKVMTKRNVLPILFI